MLQQTTVATVLPRHAAFMARWPDATAFASTPLEQVLAAWAGLGYYARARNLHAAARRIMAAGRFPRTRAELAALPGLGPYSSAAVAAIAFGEAVPVIDGNVERVIARLFGIDAQPPARRPLVEEVLAPHVPRDRPGDFAQALMDLGATICRPRAPDCAHCPLADGCHAQRHSRQAELPARAARAVRPVRYGVAWWIEAGGEVALVRRPETGLLGGMLALPGSAWGSSPGSAEMPIAGDWRHSPRPVRHVFTHFELCLEVAALRLSIRPALPFAPLWTARTGLAGLPSLYRKAATAARDLLETA
jgi:A/G-specific adenine glycosylase